MAAAATFVMIKVCLLLRFGDESEVGMISSSPISVTKFVGVGYCHASCSLYIVLIAVQDKIVTLKLAFPYF